MDGPIIILVIAGYLAAILFFAWIPGSIAKSRGHSQAEAINVCGWVGAIFLWVFWFVAFVWAFTARNHIVRKRRRNH
jgi:hypothetical protein